MKKYVSFCALLFSVLVISSVVMAKEGKDAKNPRDSQDPRLPVLSDSSARILKELRADLRDSPDTVFKSAQMKKPEVQEAASAPIVLMSDAGVYPSTPLNELVCKSLSFEIQGSLGCYNESGDCLISTKLASGRIFSTPYAYSFSSCSPAR